MKPEQQTANILNNLDYEISLHENAIKRLQPYADTGSGWQSAMRIKIRIANHQTELAKLRRYQNTVRALAH
jgi:hypothetical protein